METGTAVSGWTIIGALVTLGLLLLWFGLYVVRPWFRRLRVVATYPNLSTEVNQPPDQQVDLSFLICHEGGLLGFDGENTERVAVHCYFPEDFTLIQGKYRDDIFDQIYPQVHSGKFAGHQSVIIKGFYLVPGEHQEISVKLRTPSTTGRREIMLLIVSERDLKTLALRTLGLTVQV